jgi:hypothetical protein
MNYNESDGEHGEPKIKRLKLPETAVPGSRNADPTDTCVMGVSGWESDTW